MIRRIIEIDEEKCNGCTLCAQACHEGAIAMIDGKAKLIRDDYCDGLGDCLPTCPTGAIQFVEREAAEYDEAAVKANMRQKELAQSGSHSCPGAMSKTIERKDTGHSCPSAKSKEISREKDAVEEETGGKNLKSQLNQWPVQIQLVPVNAPYFKGANLLVAADCTAFAYGNFHSEFMKNKVTLIGCPKLDPVDYSEKLTEIIRQNDIKNVTVIRMEVPCCGGIENAVKRALIDSGKFIPWQVVTVTIDGKIKDE